VALLARVYEVGENQIRRWQDRGINLADPEELLAHLSAQHRVGSVGDRLLQPGGIDYFRQRLAAERFSIRN